MRGQEIGLTVEHGVEPAIAAQPGEQALDDPADTFGQERPSAVPPGDTKT